MNAPSFLLNALRVFLIAGAALLPQGAHAQTSTPPVTILVGFPAGGSVDFVARRLAESMQAKLSRRIVVENKVGAGGQIATQTLARADAKDGATLMLSNEHAVSIIPLTNKNPGYDVAKDVLPVATIATLPIGMAVNPSLPAKTMEDFAVWARTKQDAINVGVPAAASLPEFAVGAIGKALKRPLTSVSYRGGAPMVTDLLGGHVPVGVTAMSEMLTHHKAGKLRILAISGPQRSPLLPDVPTFAEAGIKGFEQPIFIGLFAPAATPAAVLDRYREAARAIVGSDDFRKALQELGVQAVYGDAQDLKSRVDDTTQTWAPVIRESGFVPQ